MDALATGGSYITTPSATTDKVMYADLNGDVRAITPGASGTVLTLTGGVPTWSSLTTSGTAWQLLGNGSTTYGTNFIGTTDDHALMIKINGSISGRVEDINTANNAYATTALGYLSSLQLTTGFSNTVLGKEALRDAATSSHNTAIGDSALATLTTGDNNAAVGYQALAANAGGVQNTALGYQALANYVSSNTTAIGFQAGLNLAASLGQNALVGGLVGGTGAVTKTVAIGYQAIGSATTAINNSVIIGYQAGQSFASTTASSNAVFVGYHAGQSSNTGTTDGPVFVGYNAGASNTTGANNTDVGYDAGSSNSTGNYNTYMGYLVAANNTGSNNTGIGTYALDLMGGTGSSSNTGCRGVCNARLYNHIYIKYRSK